MMYSIIKGIDGILEGISPDAQIIVIKVMNGDNEELTYLQALMKISTW